MELIPSTTDEISGALDNLTNATVQKTDMVEKLAAALCTMMDEISRLIKIIESLTTDPKKVDKPQKDWDTKGYCWSHGYKVEQDHTSKTCKNKQEGQKDDATHNNPMGGSAQKKIGSQKKLNKASQ